MERKINTVSVMDASELQVFREWMPCSLYFLCITLLLLYYSFNFCKNIYHIFLIENLIFSISKTFIISFIRLEWVGALLCFQLSKISKNVLDPLKTDLGYEGMMDYFA